MQFLSETLLLQYNLLHFSRGGGGGGGNVNVSVTGPTVSQQVVMNNAPAPSERRRRDYDDDDDRFYARDRGRAAAERSMYSPPAAYLQAAAPTGPPCSGCNLPQPAGAIFCSSCGTKSEVPAQEFCSSCGAKKVPGARFCNSCGASSASQLQLPSTAPPGFSQADDPRPLVRKGPLSATTSTTDKEWIMSSGT